MPPGRSDGMRGLAVFVSDIRNSKSKEAELKRINKELANIRSKFHSDKTLDGYQKKKYVCKLLFIFLLGHDIDFGHIEAVNLLSSNKYTEKQIGYLFISVLINTDSDLIKLIVQNIKADLQSSNCVHVNLALQCIANIGSRDMVEAFGYDVSQLLVSAAASNDVKQSASLCLLRLFRISPDVIPRGEWPSRVIHLLNDQNLGVVTAAVSLIDALVSHDPASYHQCTPLAVSRLSRIVTSNHVDLQDYNYYLVPAPWLCIKLLRLLRNQLPPATNSLKSTINEALEAILEKSKCPPKMKKVQHSNARNAMVLEAINFIIYSDSDQKLLAKGCDQLCQFLTHRTSNLRYLALDSMSLLATSALSCDTVKKHQDIVVNALKNERDVSVRQRAADLLYAVCDRTNAETIIQEMLKYLEHADYSIREEMVLKVAVLSEKYAADYTWYVDVILNLIRIAGDYVSEEVWFRVVQIVVNREDVQGYAAKTVFEALQAPACHENMVKVGGYILGEFGNLIAGDSRSAPLVQFNLLRSKYHLCSALTRALLLTTFIKFINLFAEIKPHVEQLLGADSHARSDDVELQQRACEYLNLSQHASADLLATVLEEMPPFPERESSILTILKKKSGHVPELTRPAASASSPASKSAHQSSASAATASPSTSARNESATGSTGLLVDMLGDTVTPAAPNMAAATASPTNRVSSNDVDAHAGAHTANVLQLVKKKSGVLFENQLVQIGVNSEFQKNLGRVTLFFGNKTSTPFKDFSVSVSPVPGGKLTVQAPAAATVVGAGDQIQHQINVECIEDFAGMPDMRVSFVHSGVPQSLSLQLPVCVNKFFEPTEMTANVFFTRWRSLSEPCQECQKIFKAQLPIDTATTTACLAGFGMAVLRDIDPNPDNSVCAGIVHCRDRQIGCLLRLEPNRQAQMYRLTIRSSKGGTSESLCQLLQHQF